MSEAKRVAVVSGGNRGIGFEVCRQLGKLGYTVILGGRDAADAKAAADRLRDEGSDVTSHVLDVTSQESVDAFKASLLATQGRIDILVNNAAISLDGQVGRESILESTLDTLAATWATNFEGPLRMSQAFIPVMKAANYGRVVNVSSQLGSLARMGSGYPTYRVSKVGLNALTRMLASELASQNILVNSACPGWVHTRMGGPDAPGTPEQGADTIVWLATLDDNGPRGGFFQARKPLPW